MSSLVWLITGGSSGFGREIAKVALARGDRVVATARNATKIADLKAAGATTLSLDITSGDAETSRVVAQAVKAYGQIDILVNAAGYILEGAVEECSATEIYDHFNVNVFAQATILRAVLPYMRARKSGTIANFGSIGGWLGGVGCGHYCATKFALAGMTLTLRDEVKHLGIDVTIIEPGYFRTDFLAGGHKVSAANVIDDLKPAIDPIRGAFEAYNRAQPGDVVKGAKVIVEALTKTGRCEGKELPGRLPLGRDAVQYIEGVLAKQAEDLTAWKEIVRTTDHDDVKA